MATSESAAHRERPWLPLLAFVLLGGVLLAGAFRHFDRLGAKDWNAMMGQTEAERATIQDHGQFPLWNPWRRGGQVSFAQPESMLLSPVTPLALALGTVAAFKLLLFPLFVIGCIGAWSLAGWIGLRGAARLVPPLMFYGSAIFPWYLAGGLPNWLCGLAILPWLVLWRRRAVADLRFVLPAGLAFALLIWCGSIYQFVFFPIVVGLDALAEALHVRRARPVLVAAAVLVVGAAFSLVRVLPLFDVYQVFPRELDATERHLTLPLVAKAFLDPRLPELKSLAGTVLRDGNNWVSWVTVGAYVGPVFALLALAGIVLRPKRTLGLVLFAAFFVWMSLGDAARPSLWNVLHSLPVLKSMQAPERLLAPAAFALAFAAGFGAEAILARFGNRRAFAVVLLLAAVLPAAWVNRRIAAAAFTVPPTPSLAAPGAFVQEMQQKQDLQWGGELFEAVRQNKGNPCGHSDIPSQDRVRGRGDPAYRGEAYLARDQGSVSAAFTPNVIRIVADVTQDDVLIVNQTYFPGWVAHGSVERAAEPRDYLISVPLPKGRHDFTLSFEQPSVRRGALLSALALALGLVAFVLRTRRDVDGARVTAVDAVLFCGISATLLAVPLAPRPNVAGVESVRHQGLFGGALEVDASGGAGARFAEIQQAIDATLPGETVLVNPGWYRGFRVKSGITVMAASTGRVRITGPIFVSGVPKGPPAHVVGITADKPGIAITIEDCIGPVVLQSLDGEFAIAARRADRVHVFGSRLGAVTTEKSRLTATRCRSMTQPVGIDQNGGVVLWSESEVAGAVKVRGRGRMDLSHSTVGSLEVAADSSSAISGETPPEASVRAEPGATVFRFAPEQPRIVLDHALSAGSSASFTMYGQPGSQGVLLVSMQEGFLPWRGTQQWLLVDPATVDASLKVVIPANGKLKVDMEMALAALGVGATFYGQLVLMQEVTLPSGAKDRRLRASLVEGGVVEP